MNSAFEALRGVKGLPSELRAASDDDPLFHQNDLMTIKGTQESSGKPNVVLVSTRSARIAFDQNDHSVWSDYAFKTNPPNCNFGWEDILLTVEFKNDKLVVTKPPPEYKYKAMGSIEPQSLG
jgi:hypothetical protein